MKYIIEKDVDGCYNCPSRQWHTGHGEAFNYCNHPNAPSGYGNIILNDIGLISESTAKKMPEWCPIKSKVK